MKIQLLLLLLLLSKTTFSQTLLSGKVTDEATKEDLIGASVKITKGGEVVKGAITDFNGEYRIPLDPGRYSVEASYTGYHSSKTDSVQVLNNTNNYLNFTMASDGSQGAIMLMEYKIPTPSISEYSSPCNRLTPEQIKNLPNQSVQRIVADSTQIQPQPPTKKKKKSRQPSSGKQ